MLFIFARQVRDMSLRPEAGIVMTAVTTSELNSAHNGGECQPAVTDHCEICTKSEIYNKMRPRHSTQEGGGM